MMGKTALGLSGRGRVTAAIILSMHRNGDRMMPVDVQAHQCRFMRKIGVK